jgi:hypothetical protein
LIGTLGVQMPSVVKELVNRHPGKIALRRERMAGPVKPSCCMPSRSGKALGRLRRSKPDDEKDGKQPFGQFQTDVRFEGKHGSTLDGVL